MKIRFSKHFDISVNEDQLDEGQLSMLRRTKHVLGTLADDLRKFRVVAAQITSDDMASEVGRQLVATLRLQLSRMGPQFGYSMDEGVRFMDLVNEWAAKGELLPNELRDGEIALLDSLCGNQITPAKLNRAVRCMGRMCSCIVDVVIFRVTGRRVDTYLQVESEAKAELAPLFESMASDLSTLEGGDDDGSDEEDLTPLLEKIPIVHAHMQIENAYKLRTGKEFPDIYENVLFDKFRIKYLSPVLYQIARIAMLPNEYHHTARAKTAVLEAASVLEQALRDHYGDHTLLLGPGIDRARGDHLLAWTDSFRSQLCNMRNELAHQPINAGPLVSRIDALQSTQAVWAVLMQLIFSKITGDIVDFFQAAVVSHTFAEGFGKELDLAIGKYSRDSKGRSQR